VRIRLDDLGADQVLAQVGVSSFHRTVIAFPVPLRGVFSETLLRGLCKILKYEDIALPNILPLNRIHLESF